jgi:catechol-2,3-dioxygenase
MAGRKRLGELVLRSDNPPALIEFYRDVIGLEPYATIGSATFLKVADDFEGHPQLLAIFEKSHAFSGPKNNRPDIADAGGGTLHHFAFVLDHKDFLAERDRLQANGIDLKFAEHRQFGWRSIYMHDPDGNSVELVCYDSAILDPAANQQVRRAAEDLG